MFCNTLSKAICVVARRVGNALIDGTLLYITGGAHTPGKQPAFVVVAAGIGEIGSGHPDPDIGFAEGKFYLINQTKHDYVSSGPWVEKVTARVGVDTNNDGKADTWSDWQEIKERYDHIKGFSKQIQRIPASMDLSQLPAGYGFCFELRMEDTTANPSKPMLDSLEVCFD